MPWGLTPDGKAIVTRAVNNGLMDFQVRARVMARVRAGVRVRARFKVSLGR